MLHIARLARVMAPGLLLHVTLQGNRWLPTFFEEAMLTRLRLHARTGRSLGSEIFLLRLEAQASLVVLPQKRVPHAGSGFWDRLSIGSRAGIRLVFVCFTRNTPSADREHLPHPFSIRISLMCLHRYRARLCFHPIAMSHSSNRNSAVVC